VSLRSDEWRVTTCPARDASELVRRYHYSHSTANTCVASHGLYREAEGILSPLYGAALWMPPLPPAGRAVVREGEDWRGVLVLSRLVVHPDVPTNGASFLLGRSMQLIDRDRWPVLLTYADTRLGHTGAIYKATNWELEGEVAGGDVWIGPNGEQRGRRRGPKVLSADEMRAEGFERAPAAPKLRFVHRDPRIAWALPRPLPAGIVPPGEAS
jgi:hypothetical protein